MATNDMTSHQRCRPSPLPGWRQHRPDCNRQWRRGRRPPYLHESSPASVAGRRQFPPPIEAWTRLRWTPAAPTAGTRQPEHGDRSRSPEIAPATIPVRDAAPRPTLW